MSTYKRADRRKYHLIYKTTCIITGKYYVGMHSTDNKDDGYKGSGKYLWHSINKHGLDKHITEILYECDNRELLREIEKELITEEMLSDKLCMNLKYGGEGGWDNVNKNISKEERKIRAIKANRIKANHIISNDEYSKIFRQNLSKGQLRRYNNHGLAKGFANINGIHWVNRKHTLETIEKIKTSKINHGLGKTNSQYGTCWITNGTENKKIKKEELDSWLTLGWKQGRILQNYG